MSGLLGRYCKRAEARRLAHMTEDERLENALSHVEAAHPGEKGRFLAGASKCWDTDPFQRGAYACFKPGGSAPFGGVPF